MSNATPRERLFGKVRAGLSPSAEDRRRVRSALTRRLGAAAGAGAAATAVRMSARAAPVGFAGVTGSTAPVLVKLAIPLVVLGLGVTVGVLPESHSFRALPRPASTLRVNVERPPVATLAATPVAATATVPVRSSPVGSTEATAPSRHAVPSVAPRSSTSDSAPTAVPRPEGVDDVQSRIEEITLVAEIQSALRGHDEHRALVLVADHERRFPHGILAEEREGARVLALCVSAPAVEAAALERSFLALHPRSPLVTRISLACGTSRDRP